MLIYYMQVLVTSLGSVCASVCACVYECMSVWEGERNQCHVFPPLIPPPPHCRHFFPCTPLLLGVTCTKLSLALELSSHGHRDTLLHFRAAQYRRNGPIDDYSAIT